MSVQASHERFAGVPARRRGRRPGPGRRLIGDAYIASRLFGHMLRRIAGVRPDASLLTTLFALAVLANALRHVAEPALKVFRGPPPSLASTVMAGAVVREIPGSIGGAGTRSKPFAGTLIMISLAVPAVPAVRRAVVTVLRLPGAFAASARRYYRGQAR
ncbi:MAG TPA: hypothetical protein VKG82_09005 [Solirubrobacteraceae bacterium]|nr:hypothetical protein [Solirubrobacteraceae bacterium]